MFLSTTPSIFLLYGDRHQSSCGNTDDDGSSASKVVTSKKNKTIIAYATTVTDCKSSSGQDRLIERAAVLHMSIKLATKKANKYRYHIYAFVHPDALKCIPSLQNLGYRIQIHDTPFNKSAIPNENLIIAQGNGCCGEKVRAENVLFVFVISMFSYQFIDCI